MAGYLGSVPVPQATQHRETFTATAGQTTFNTAGYTPLFVDVYLNGVHLSPADITATNGSDVVLAECVVNDIVDIVSYTPFEVASQTFTGTTTMDVASVGGTLGVTGVVTANGGVIFNEAGEAAPDFRVESNSFDHMFFVNGGLNNTAIGFNALPENQGAGLGILTGSGDGGVHLFREDGSFPSADESLGSFGWSGADSSGSLSTADAKITAFANENMAAGDAGTNIQFFTKANGVNQGTAPTRAMVIASTGQVRFEDGSASVPSISNSGDTNTGMFFRGADQIGFSAGGTEIVAMGSFGVAVDTIINKASAGDLTLDVAGDIILDADGGDVFLKDDGTEYARFTQVSGGLRIQTVAQDTDIVFRGNDNGGDVDALTLAMSAGGTAVFGGELHVKHSATSDSHYFQMENDNNNTYMYTSTSSSVNKGLKIYHANAGGSLAFAMDSSGHITKPLQPAFLAKSASSQSNIATSSQVNIVLGTEVFDQNSDFASNTFTAPVTGRYQLQAFCRTDNVDSAADYYELKILTSNAGFGVIFDPDFGQDNAYHHLAFSILADMDLGDTASLQIRQEGGSSQTDLVDTKFSGFLAC